MMNLILFGPPGAGKGTQTKILCKRLGVPNIATGDALREEIRRGTELGRRCGALMDGGKLVPDEIVSEIIRRRIEKPDCGQGFVLDGFPRNLAQALKLEELGVAITKAVVINVPDEVLVERIRGRLVCGRCGRTFHVTNVPPRVKGVCDGCGGRLSSRRDDRPETVRERLRTYHEATCPVVDHYRRKGLLREVDGTLPVQETTGRILKALEE